MATDQNWIKSTGQIATHVLIVTLFRYLQQNYMSSLEVDDPTEYWDTQDMDTLQLEHARMGVLIGLFREPENVKSLLKLAGFEDVEQVRPVAPEELSLRASKPEQTKDWRIAAHEN
ncbi:MAG: hypothetical protein ACPGWR_03055 [Ardenticatenaceae bacterium]